MNKWLDRLPARNATNLLLIAVLLLRARGGSGVELQTCSRRRGRASTEMYLPVHSLVRQCRALPLCLLGISGSCRLAEPRLSWDTDVE